MKKSVCIIDDDDDVRDVVAYALESDGFVVMAFANPKLAVDSLKSLDIKNHPGLILVDFQMPIMNGISFINHVRAEYPQTIGKIPLALCSARDGIDSPGGLPENILLLNKPMELDDLLNIVRAHCTDS